MLNSADEHETKNILRDSKWGLKIVESKGKVIFGKHARTMICSNLFDPNVKEKWVSSESNKTKGGIKNLRKKYIKTYVMYVDQHTLE